MQAERVRRYTSEWLGELLGRVGLAQPVRGVLDVHVEDVDIQRAVRGNAYCNPLAKALGRVSKTLPVNGFRVYEGNVEFFRMNGMTPVWFVLPLGKAERDRLTKFNRTGKMRPHVYKLNLDRVQELAGLGVEHAS